MDTSILSQWQFGITSIYHFFFVPLTLGLSILVAFMETLYVATGKEVYKSMTKFWGKLFLINFAMGVVTGLVMEFQFGMNWSEFSRFVGNIFGAPLAIEALLAFFLESVFLGIWIFGWDKLSKGMHLLSIWLVALGSTLSALWILIANSFMQQPVGYIIVDGQAYMTSFFALLLNPNVWYQFPHTVLSGFVTGSFFIIGISLFHLVRKNEIEIFNSSIRIASVFGLISVILVILVGHRQAQHMIETQPMKIAAAEALWVTQDPASLSLITIADEAEMRDIISIRIPNLLSLLAYDKFTGEVRGITDLQEEYSRIYGPGDYSPPIAISYWSFRIMVGSGFLMLLIVVILIYGIFRKKEPAAFKFAKFFPLVIAIPYLANSSGWILTEIGRQPWVVFGLLKTSDAVSPNISVGMVLSSLVIFTLLYGILMAADIFLLAKYARNVSIEMDIV
jgi:cytochrome bd ubiquinol oxidase subunit I